LKKVLATVALAAGFWADLASQARDGRELQQLYADHNWFELRAAIRGPAISPLYAGAVASAFNKTADAEKLLKRAVREATAADVATDAREALINLYFRVGRTADAVRVVDEALAAAPSRSDFRNIQMLFGAFRGRRNQTARLGRGKPFSCTVTARGVYLPVDVNGHRVEWLFDSAFSTSALTESEAAMLGVQVQHTAGEAGDFTGATTKTRAAMIDRMTIGDAHLRNVLVLVFPDSQPPWNELPVGRRGTIGVPIAVALHAIRWALGGVCQVGVERARTRNADVNLAFDGLTPVTRVRLDGRFLDLVVDTGNQAGMQLWPLFAADFPELVSRGTRSTRDVRQIGGASEQAVIAIPEIRLRVGGLERTLQPANVFSRPIGNDFQHGNLGFDIFGAAMEVSIDFDTMSLSLR
jgi:Aspartyl protease